MRGPLNGSTQDSGAATDTEVRVLASACHEIPTFSNIELSQTIESALLFTIAACCQHLRFPLFAGV